MRTSDPQSPPSAPSPSSPVTGASGENPFAGLRKAIEANFEREIAEEARLAETLRAEVVPKVRAAVAELRASGRCGRAWLFGSYAWDEPIERSDVDLLVESDDPFGIAGHLIGATGRMAHVISIEDAPPSLRERATREGVEL